MKDANVWKVLVVALVVFVVAAALVVPIGGALARVGGDGPTAAVCQSGHACGGRPVAALCQSGFSCGGRQVAVWPLPGTNAVCQSGASCGG